MMSFDVLPTTPICKYNHGESTNMLGLCDKRSIVMSVNHLEAHPILISSWILMNIPTLNASLIPEKLLLLSSEVYNHASQSTIVEVASHTHAVAVSALDHIFQAWPRFDDTSILDTGEAGFRGETISKIGAMSWIPIDPSSGELQEWSSLVGEVAWSEPRRKLLQDIEFWFKEFNSQSKVAIAMTVHARGRITIEQWGRNPRPDGNMDLRITAQRIEIVRKPAPNCPRVSANLKLQFRDIYLREKKEIDKDFVVTEKSIELLAFQVWNAQFRKDVNI